MNKKQLLIGFVIAAALIVVGAVRGIHKAPAQDIVPQAPKTVDENMKLLSMSEQIEQKREAARREKAQAAIKEHEEAIQRDWSSEDTPARILAIGNLYLYQLKDPYAAIANYRSFIDHFPNHRKTPQVYLEIVRSYHQIGDEQQIQYVYQEMVDKLDPSLLPTQYAKKRLEEMQ